MDQNSKHSPAVDDALTDPRRNEPAGYRHDARPNDGDRDEGVRTPARDDVDTPPGALPAEEVEARSDLARFLLPSAFPDRPAALRAAAAENDAPAWVHDALDRLPDEVYENVEQMWEQLGGHRERRSA